MSEIKPQYITTKRKNGSIRYQENPELIGKSKTQQHFTKRCNIQNIINGHKKTGIYNHVHKNAINPQYLDNPIQDFQEIQEQISSYNTYFESLPALIRAKFDNKSQNLLSFIALPENKEESQKLGILPPPPLDLTNSATPVVEPVVSTETTPSTNASENEADQPPT